MGMRLSSGMGMRLSSGMGMGLSSSMGMKLASGMGMGLPRSMGVGLPTCSGGVAYLCEQCRPQVGAVSTGNLCGAAYKLLCESHEGNKLRGNKVLQKTSLEENSG